MTSFLKFFDSHLNVADCQTDEQVHEDDADQDGEDEDHGVSGERVERLAILIDEILVLDLAGHHYQSLHNCRRNVDIEALKIKSASIKVFLFSKIRKFGKF